MEPYLNPAGQRLQFAALPLLNVPFSHITGDCDGVWQTNPAGQAEHSVEDVSLA